MILFKPYHVNSILHGLKTCTRRLGFKRWNVGSIHEAKTKYTSDSCFAHLRIFKVYQQQLKFMTINDANAEGGYTIHDCKITPVNKETLQTCQSCSHYKTCFQVVWTKINGSWNPEEHVWVIYFECVNYHKITPMENTTELM